MVLASFRGGKGKPGSEGYKAKEQAVHASTRKPIDGQRYVTKLIPSEKGLKEQQKTERSAFEFGFVVRAQLPTQLKL